jgi:tol-pal system protein YbgF
MRARGAALALLAAGAACASPSDVRRVQNEVALLRAESARQDSARAARLTEILRVQQRIMDSLESTRRSVQSLKGDTQQDLYNIQQQLVQLQELTGQSQRRLTELRTQLDARGEQLGMSGGGAPAPGDTTRTAGGPGPAPNASADQMYDASLQQLRKGSTSTARSGLSELLKTYPTSERVPDALYFIGQSWATENPDSARFYYNEVVRTHPESPRAASALYNLGLLAERRKDNASARESYQRVIAKYPKSDEAALAKDRLKALGR